MSFEKSQMRLVALILAVTTALLFATYFFVFRVPLVPVYENIRESDASAIVAELETAGVPYRLENQGHDILVPEDRAAEARVRVAGSNVAMGGTVGFELFNDSDMGLTEFAQKINLQRALQGELARTIMGMEDVAFARVHLALPERTIFRSEQSHPTAAVTLQMKPGHSLTPQRIEGVRQLVAYSVPDLQAQSVAILDEKGDLVSGLAAPGFDSGGPLTERAALEQYLEARANEAIAAQMPGLRLQVTVNSRENPSSTVPAESGSRAGPIREELALNVIVRSADELADEDRGLIQATLVDALELDPTRGDALHFSVGLVAPTPVAVASLPVASSVQPATTGGLTDAGNWSWLFSRWTLFALVLGGIVVLLVRPRRRLADDEAASFAELLKDGMTAQERGDAL